VPVGYTDGHQARVTVSQPVPSAAFVRRTGEDVQTGDVAVRRGSPIGAAQVGLLAAVGRSKVLIYPRPRVSVISFGDELVDIDRLCLRYTGKPFARRKAKRVSAWIEPLGWHGWDDEGELSSRPPV